MRKTHLAPGFRFHPTDVELLKYYLKRKLMGKRLLVEAIADVDIYKFEPSDLPDKSYLKTGDLKWYFFCPIEKKYGSGVRTNRATEFGYWKSTGKDRTVVYCNETVGRIKTLVFHRGKSPRGERTDWVIHEYKLEDKELTRINVSQDEYVLCVLFKKDGPGPRNGAQYGAPFKENEWSDAEEEEETVNVSGFLPSVDLRGPAKEMRPAATTSRAVKDIGGVMISESCVSDFRPLVDAPRETHDDDDNDDIYAMLDCFVDDGSGSTLNEVRQGGGSEDIFSGLPDLSNLEHMPAMAPYVENTPLFLELDDLAEPLTVPPETPSGSRYLSRDQFGCSTDLSQLQPFSDNLKEHWK